jgi:hypothetical protein
MPDRFVERLPEHLDSGLVDSLRAEAGSSPKPRYSTRMLRPDDGGLSVPDRITEIRIRILRLERRPWVGRWLRPH